MEATTTLADALLDDLDDLSDVEDTEQSNENGELGVNETENGGDDDEDDDDGDKKLAPTTKPAENRNDGVNAGTLLSKSSSSSSSSFLNSENLQGLLQKIRERKSNTKPSMKPQKEQEEENHQLVVQSNKQLAKLGDEMARAHGDLATAYKPKFPELEELLPDAVQYKNAVRIIWNEMDLTNVNDELNEILNNNQVITISISGSTTSGRPLTPEELQKVDQSACYIEKLLEIQKELVQFVEESMESLTPSVCALVGPSTAAQLLGLAGGLAELTKIPACNLQVLGQVKHNSTSRAGLSSTSIKQHVGVLAGCDLVQSCPKPMQKKALKTVAAKLALAARYDFVNVDTGRPRSAQAGLQFREEVKQKFEKLMEPDKAPVLKALPKPDLTVKKRRGGKRMRRWKERFEETSMMKQANTRAFANQAGAEYGDDAMGISMGLLDTADSGGAIRKSTEKRKVRQANTKASRKRAMQMAQRTSNSNGLASSMVLTAVTGMELVNPDANKDRVRDANRKWFSDNAGFQSALPKK